MAPKKKSAAAAKAAAIAAGKRKVGEGSSSRPPTRSSGRLGGGGSSLPAPPPPLGSSKKTGNSRKQKAPQRSRAAADDEAGAAPASLDALAATAAAAAAGTTTTARGNNNNANGGAGPSSSRPAADFKPSSRGRKGSGRAIPGAPPAPSGPLNVPKVSLKVELSTLGGVFVGRKALSVVVPADAALWDVRRSIDATCRSLNNGIAPPQAARMTMRTIDVASAAAGGAGGAGAGGEAGTSAGGGGGGAAAAAPIEGPPLTLETVHNGKETYLASYSIVPCPGGVYTLEMRPTKLSREQEARRAGKRVRRSIEGGDGGGEGDDGGFGALGGSGPRGRGRPRSAHLNPSGRPRSASNRAALSKPPPIADDGSRVHLDNGARKRIKWSTDETAILVSGVQRFGDGRWSDIRRAHLALFESTGRTDVDLKDKWRNLKRAMRRDSVVAGLTAAHQGVLRAAVADDDSKAAGGGGD